MALEFRRSEVLLSGSCPAEEALELSEWLANRKRPKVNLAACSHMHTSILQTLLAHKPAISAAPEDPFLNRWIVPMLTAVPDVASRDERS